MEGKGFLYMVTKNETKNKDHCAFGDTAHGIAPLLMQGKTVSEYQLFRSARGNGTKAAGSDRRKRP